MGTPNPVTGEAVPETIPDTMTDREAIETAIEELIDLLDRIEPDPDLEENGDLEPSISCHDDRELDLADDEEDDPPEESDPDEHVMGWTDEESQRGKLGAGEDWTELNGDERDFSDCEDNYGAGWAKPLDYREACEIHQDIHEKLESIKRSKGLATPEAGQSEVVFIQRLPSQ